MIDPVYFRDARLTAAHWVQARIVGYDGAVQARVVRVFRGPLRFLARLELHLNFAEPLRPGDALGSDFLTFQRARFLEAFLDGDPPDVVCEQVKFIARPTWRPRGDPGRTSYDW